MNAIDAAPASVAERRITVWLFLGALCVLLVFQYGGVSGLDGETMYASARALVDDRSLDVGPGFNTLPGNGGGEYARPNFGLPLVAAVIYLLTAPVDWLLPAYADFVRAAAVGASMAVVGAALVVAAFRLARRLGARLWPALVAGVGTVAGTFLLPYSKEFFTEPVAALTTIFAIERALAGRSLSAGVGAAAAGAVRAASFLFAPLVILVILRRRGIREAVIASVPVAAAGILTVGYNLARFGHPLHFGYQDAEFSTPFFEGARFLLFDPSYSVAIFAPAIVLVPSALVHLRHNRDALLLLVGNFAAVFALNATWLSPRGGWSWGPRLLTPVSSP